VKKDIRQAQFSSIVGWRGDSLACPQAFGGDCWGGCSMGCWFCFCRESEEEMFTKYFDGWSRDLVRPCNPDDFRRLFDRAFSDKPTDDWNLLCLRRGLPFNMGSKAETFNLEDVLRGPESIVVRVLEIFREYGVPIIFETKSHYIGLSRYLDLIKNLKCAVIVSIMGGSDTLNYKLEPGCASPSTRWRLVETLNKMGIWCGVRWEPILCGINSTQEIFDDFADKAKKYGAKHVSIYGYRTSLATRAQVEFESRGYDYIKLLERSLDKNWRPVGKQLIQTLKSRGVPVSSPDFVNFPFDNDRESCCGIDGLFPMYHFTFQYACKQMKKVGTVCWMDMEAVEFKHPEVHAKLRQCWNGGGGIFTLADSPEIQVVGKDPRGLNIYAPRTTPPPPPVKKGFGLGSCTSV